QVDGPLLFRRMDRFTPRVVPETDGATLPFFNPEGTAIGFFRGGSVWRVDVTDSTPIRLASAAPLGGAWGDGGRIVFAATDRSGLLELDTRTGTITPVTHLDPARDEISHRWPTFLPGGGEVLFNIVHRGDARGDEAEIALLALDTGRRTTLIDGGTRPAFVAPRHLLFSRAGSLMAVPLGPDGRHPAGTPFTVVESLRWSPESGATGYALSRADPILVYTASHAPAGSPGLAWFDAAGRIIRTHPLATPIHDMRIAPGGDRLAATVGSIQAGVALESIGAGHPLRDLAGPAGAHHPVWSPDGSHLAFSITEPRGNRLMTMRADGSDTRSLPGSGRDRTAESWSVDGASLAFSEWRDDTGLDLLIVHPSEPGPPAPLHASPYNEREARFSPVGGWLAYTSDESERTEVYVERFPGGEDRLQVSSSGGSHPFWSADGSRLYYRQGDGIYAVTVKLAGSVSASAPCRLFTAPAGTRFVGTDRTGDLVAVRSGEAAGATRVEVMAGFAHALSHSSRAATTTVAVRQP
ncbi:MAG: TolB family protein, partial [Acidobacteriota bacterium]